MRAVIFFRRAKTWTVLDQTNHYLAKYIHSLLVPGDVLPINSTSFPFMYRSSCRHLDCGTVSPVAFEEAGHTPSTTTTNAVAGTHGGRYFKQDNKVEGWRIHFQFCVSPRLVSSLCFCLLRFLSKSPVTITLYVLDETQNITSSGGLFHPEIFVCPMKLKKRSSESRFTK